MLRSMIVTFTCMLAPAIAAAAPAGPFQAPGQEVSAKPDRCLARNLRVPQDLAEHLPDSTDVWFHVAASGKVTDLHAGDVATRAISPYLRDALSRCDWTRAMALANDSAGEVELRLRFAS